MRFTIRDFCSVDFDHLYAIDQACFPEGIAYSRRELAHYMKMKGSFTLVAETVRSHEIAGFIVAQTFPKGLGHIITIDTLAKHRRSGLGTTLMSLAEERLVQTGCGAIFLEAAINNLPALAFYKKFGYHVVKTLRRYYKNELDAFLLVKRLSKTP